jgi:hypothetical protein
VEASESAFAGSGLVREAPADAQPRSSSEAAALRGGLAFFHPQAPTLDLSAFPQLSTATLTAQQYAVTTPASGHEVKAVRSLPDGSFANVLCADSIAKVPREHLITYALELARLLRPGGRLVLSYQGEGPGSQPPGKLVLLLESAGFRTVRDLRAETGLLSISVCLWMEKAPLGGSGLEVIQSVLAQDAKFATYKYALVRALAVVSRNEPNSVVWEDGEVYVPLFSLALRWLVFYWPLLTHAQFIAQTRAGERSRQLAFRPAVQSLHQGYGAGGLYSLLRDIDQNPKAFEHVLKLIGETIKKGPVRYAGTGSTGIFRHAATLQARSERGALGMGWVVVPEPLWLSISRFEHWIEDSLVVRWAQLTAEMNQTEDTGLYLSLLLATPDAERDTQEVRRLLKAAAKAPECVWSGKPLGERFDVDHAIPYSVWRNNDLWNLLPCDAKLNNSKRDKLPSGTLLLQSRDRIIEYWRLYDAAAPGLFAPQALRALGCATPARNWEVQAFTGLQENVERLALARGLPRWAPELQAR